MAIQGLLKLNQGFFPRFKRLFKVWISRKSLTNRIVTGLIVLGSICGLMTYGALMNVPPFGNSNSNALLILLNADLIILLCLVILVCRRLIGLWVSRRKGLAGSNLHIRLVSIFSLLAALPAIFMAVFSIGFFYLGIHGWLDERVRTAVNESQAVAEAYLAEHQQLIRADILAMANDLDRQAAILSQEPEAMARMIKTQSLLRNFSEVFLFDSGGQIHGRSNMGSRFDFAAIPPQALDRAASGDVALLNEDGDSIRALLKLNNYADTYLYVDRMVDPKVLGHVERARKGVAQYRDLQMHSTRLQVLLTSIYVVVTLLLTISAVWFGLSFARRLMAPITSLISTSERVRNGDLSARVDTGSAMDEFKTLARAFNRMTEQIESQQKDLINANAQMDFRRRFTETILGGVSTGILSVDESNNITLANNASGELLHEPIESLLGQKISYIMPELMPYLDLAFEHKRIGDITTCEISIRRSDAAVRTFMARIVIEEMEEAQKSAIITFDDLTNVLAAQRKAAWADIARRIAHEIKNPLTPIQLSAERLNRKYRKGLTEEDQAVFDQCTDTIIRHVSDIKTMVNAFSSFAKMPDPVIKNTDILPLVRDVYALHEAAHNNIAFSCDVDESVPAALIVPHDEQQIRQVMTNLIKNAVEALDTVPDKAIQIKVVLDRAGEKLYVGVLDSGIGLPEGDIEKLTEPYVTHKPKGTGLGLAIVKKIIEDHQGELLFYPTLPILGNDNDSNTFTGAAVYFSLPIKPLNYDA